MDVKKISGFLLDCDPDTFLKLRNEGDGGVVVIDSVGRKYRFSLEQLEKGEIAMAQTQTLAEAAKGLPAAAHAPTQSPKPRTTKRKPTTKKTPTKKTKPSSKADGE